MKQACLLCERTSPDGNLFCQESYCPAEMSPTILDSGEWFGDVEVVKPIIVLRTCVLYEARHQKNKVLLKIAHPGSKSKERLKREAEFLRALQLSRQRPKTLPLLLPPYANTTLAQDAYGKMMLREHLLYFSLFEFFQGEPLRDVLVKNPQLWVNHAGWLAISLAITVNFLHLHKLYHFSISPDCILVRFDQDPSAPRILLFDLGIASDGSTFKQNWDPAGVAPAYTAPELVPGNDRMQAPDYRTDVYGVGLTLYEMLLGQPAFTYKLRSDAEVYENVIEDRRNKLLSIEVIEHVSQIVLRAVNNDRQVRQQTVADLAEQLIQQFGPVPAEKKRRLPAANTIYLVVGAFLVIAFLIALAVTLSGIRG